MFMIRFTPSQLGDLSDLCRATAGSAPNWRAIHRRAATLQRTLHADDARPLAGQRWALDSLQCVLEQSAKALRAARTRG